ncbi:MAG: LptA/OstA family protein [Spirochaetales bacterium]
MFFYFAGPVSAEVFQFSGDQVNTILARGRERTLLRGNAIIRSDNTQITAKEIEIYGKDFQFARCTGGVRAWDSEKQILITCETLTYDRKEKIIIASGNAYMEDRKNEMIVRGERLENRDKDDLTIIQINVRILKKDLSARAEYVRYQRDTEILELSGLPVVYWKKDNYRAARIVMNLKTDEITLIGDVSGAIVSKPEKEKDGE